MFDLLATRDRGGANLIGKYLSIEGDNNIFIYGAVCVEYKQPIL